MFEAAVDGFGGTACDVEVVEVGQEGPGSALERPAQRHELDQAPRDARGGQRVDVGLHQSLARTRVGCSVRIDNVLVDDPGHPECDALLAGEQVEYAVLLTQRE